MNRQQRYAKRYPERVKASLKKYRASEKYRIAHRRHMRKYKRSAAGKAANQRGYLKSYSQNPALWIERSRNYRRANPQKYKEQGLAWRKTPQGKRYSERNNLKLPADAPDSLVKAIRQLGSIKKEIANHEYP